MVATVASAGSQAYYAPTGGSITLAVAAVVMATLFFVACWKTSR